MVDSVIDMKDEKFAVCPCGQSRWLIMYILNRNLEKYYRWDYKYSSALNGWYKYHEMPAVWLDARKQCALEAAIIMSPINDTFMSVIRELVTLKPNRLPNIFTGFNTILSTGYFISYEGILLDSITHEWAKDEPKRLKNVGNGTCLTVDGSGKFAVVNCTEFFPFVCYKKYKDLKNNSCGYISGYDYDKSTDTCYKVYATPKKRSDAHRACAADGGALAAAGGAVQRYFRNRDVYGLIGDYLQIGVHSLYEKNEWLTVHGESLNEAQRDNLKILNERHRCASMWKNGEMWTVQCDSAQPFVCQKKRDLGYGEG
ncbi:hypothetical protein EVAR_82540_1 [Eumeta japonica]|uniref:C-type lectin domain-containing protein n=1 Tax=Eumeta variegata TaxID=151549 RepID=A0A4C1UWI7_EUMVA|nr:hypothetical protein EVAR_82540_1 [Eumeta japonica]